MGIAENLINKQLQDLIKKIPYLWSFKIDNGSRAIATRSGRLIYQSAKARETLGYKKGILDVVIFDTRTNPATIYFLDTKAEYKGFNEAQKAFVNLMKCFGITAIKYRRPEDLLNLLKGAKYA